MTVSAHTIKMKFPEFVGAADDATIELAIEEARVQVDSSWLPSNIDLATEYFAAHRLMVTISRIESASGQMVKSETVGPLSITYATPNQPTELLISDLTTTPYGVRFLELCEHNFPGVLVI